MKILVMFLIVGMAQAWAIDTFSQSNTLTLKKVACSVDQIIDEIEKATGYNFLYNQSFVDLERKITVDVKDKNIVEVLDVLFAGSELNYRIIDKQIILFPKEEQIAKTIQQGSVKVHGKVTDHTGEPLPGVNVYEQSNQSHGVITGIDGSYNIEVSEADAILVFSFIGFQSQEIKVAGRSEINIFLAEEMTGLDEVVVTALGIKREKKALGYSTQTVGSEDLEKAESPDLASKLTGKVAGLQINTAATIGGSSRIVLRGESSLGLSGNEALIVVDGVPVNTEGSYAGGIDWGNGFSDFNSNDIESVNVLKGAAAAALYGSRAGNGVVLITTKKGVKDKPFTVEFNSSLMFESLLTYPDTYQYEYAVGEADTRLMYNPITGHYNPAARDETWASEKYDPNRMIEWWFSPTENGYRAADTGISDKGEAQKLPYVSTGKNNYEEFFEVGNTFYNQIAISSSGEHVTSRFSIGDMNQKGMQPGTDLKRRSISASFNSELSDKVKLDFSFNYIKTTSDNRPRQHWGPYSINYVLSWMMPGVYMNELKNYWQPGLEGTHQINWRSGHNNPYFLAHEVKAGLAKDRFFGNVNLSYNMTDKLSFMLRHGDDFTMNTTSLLNPFGATSDPSLSRSKGEVRESNTDFLLTYDNKFSDIWGVNVSVGANRRNTHSEYLSGYSGIMLVPDLFTINNTSTTTSASEGISNKRVYSFISLANISYKNRLYLALTARNSWSSTLPTENNSYFFPSASLSVLMNEIVSLPQQISFLKLRTAVAQVGKDTDPHELVNVLSEDGRYGSYTGFAIGSVLKNPELKPEIVTSLEFGLESKFFNNRLSFDFDYYTTETVNQVIGITLPSSSGYGSRLVNAGKIENSGIEFTLGGSPVKNPNFQWDMTINYSRNRNKVIELAEGIDKYDIAGYGDSGEMIRAVVGGPIFGVYGYKQATVEDPTSPYYGQKVYGLGGTPIRKNDPEYLGQANPDFIVGLNNRFRYKDLSFSFLLDMRKGGVAYSNATNIMYGGGFNTETAEWRNNGYIGDGVKVSSDGTYAPNDVVIKGDDVKAKLITAWRDISTNNIFSSSFIKVREVNLAYNLPSSLMNRIPIDRISISLVGRNILQWDKIPNQDADVFHNGIPGYTGGYTYPTARTYGVSLNVTF